jgi:hypothetical protein
VSSACSACVQSKCATQVSGAETGCSDLLSCVCPNGTLDEALAAQCASKAQEASCTSATKTLSSCESASCSSECG